MDIQNQCPALDLPPASPAQPGTGPSALLSSRKRRYPVTASNRAAAVRRDDAPPECAEGSPPPALWAASSQRSAPEIAKPSFLGTRSKSVTLVSSWTPRAPRPRPSRSKVSLLPDHPECGLPSPEAPPDSPSASAPTSPLASSRLPLSSSPSDGETSLLTDSALETTSSDSSPASTEGQLVSYMEAPPRPANPPPPRRKKEVFASGMLKVKIGSEYQDMSVRVTDAEVFFYEKYKTDIKKPLRVNLANAILRNVSQTKLSLRNASYNITLEAKSSTERDGWASVLNLVIHKLEINRFSYGVKIFNVSGDLLIPFYRQHNPGITLLEFINYINSGTELLYEICKDDSSTPNKAIPTQIVSIMWSLYAKLAVSEDLFISGTMRIDDPDRKLYNFIKSCDNVYPRISTHMVERLPETLQIDGYQKGLDLINQNLPAGKNTILFFPMYDGTTVIKLEEHGCPPFWKKEFMSVGNTLEFYRHSVDFIKSLFPEDIRNMKWECPVGVQEDPSKAFSYLYPGLSLNTQPLQYDAKREHVSDVHLEAFSMALNYLYPEIPLNTQMVLLNPSTPKEKIFVYGKTFGVSTMLKVIYEHKDYKNSTLLKGLLKDEIEFYSCSLHKTPNMWNYIWGEIDIAVRPFQKLVDEDKKKNYMGERKGNEATLPNPKYWDEFKSLYQKPFLESEEEGESESCGGEGKSEGCGGEGSPAEGERKGDGEEKPTQMDGEVKWGEIKPKKEALSVSCRPFIASKGDVGM